MNKLIAFIFSASLRVVINIMLAAILGYKAVQLFLLFNATPSIFIHNLSSQSHYVVNHPQLVTPTLDISSLLKEYLFGKSTYRIATQIANTPPETKLDLKLHGIYYSDNNSYAMITIAKEKKSSYYRINQPLPNGALVHQIYPNKVILLRNERTETLYLVGNKSVMTNNLSKNYANSMPKYKSPNNAMRPGKLLSNYQHQLQTNPNKLMKLVRMSPVNQGGHLLGYRIRPGKDATLLSRFDLQSGDILTAVNGVELNSPLKGLGVVQQLATTKHVDLQILRKGQAMSLSFAVER
ncbi:type II secretion system protein GspC [Candidatus Parabeggiatoa sp. HSG14]|uniref:type II secretion system protein GspC n=1 Tax=Candidatus Parabeggiatoa sp. HSG14 TaxID=3055593 RepID=UPI0025A8C2E1|nr:type II secretion system protein GspC [Thiotrichales bacterium HSG14]